MMTVLALPVVMVVLQQRGGFRLLHRLDGNVDGADRGAEVILLLVVEIDLVVAHLAGLRGGAGHLGDLLLELGDVSRQHGDP